MENSVSHALFVLEEPVQYVCLLFMATMYAIKIYQLLQKPVPTDKAELKGDRTTGAITSLFNVLMPWSMESTRNNLYFYAEFLVFHIGATPAAAQAISLSKDKRGVHMLESAV